jgi:hypothetical protein
VIRHQASTPRRRSFLLALLSPLESLRARRRAREEAEDAADLALLEERLRNPEGPPIPLEQVKRELGL